MTVTTQSLPELHPAAALLPAMEREEYETLRESIHEHGQQEPCVMLDGKLLDGRHRYTACIDLGIEPKLRDYAGECGSPISFVLAQNVHRRHLTPGQRATLAVDVLPLYESEAKERQREAGGSHQYAGTEEPLEANLPQAGRAPQARTKAAQATGASDGAVKQAKKLKAEAPDLFAKVKSGKTTLNAAVKDAEKHQRQDDADLLKRATESDAKVAAARLKASYSRALSYMTENFLPLDPAAVARTLDAGDWNAAESGSDELRDWFARLFKARAVKLHLVQEVS